MLVIGSVVGWVGLCVRMLFICLLCRLEKSLLMPWSLVVERHVMPRRDLRHNTRAQSMRSAQRKHAAFDISRPERADGVD